MLRINLLPGYVAQRRLNKQLTTFFTVAFIICILAPLAYWLGYQTPHYNQIKTAADEAVTGKGITDALKQKAVATLAQIAPLQAKVDCVTAVHQYNKTWPAIYAIVGSESYRANHNIRLSSASITGNSLKLQAHSPSIAEITRYLEYMYQSNIVAGVSIDKLPGYPEATINKYYLDGKLIGSDAPSSGGGGAASMGGMPGGAPGGVTMTGFGGGGPRIGGFSGPTGGIGGGGLPGMPSASGGSAQGAPTDATLRDAIAGTLNPLASAEQQQRAIDAARRRIKVVKVPTDFEVAITATLKQTMLMPPVLPGAAGAAAGKGGGMPGMGAGMPPGMPGGMPGGAPGAKPAPRPAGATPSDKGTE